MNPELGPDLQTIEKPPDPQWSPLVERVRCGDSQGMEELYALFAKGVRYFLWRHLGSQDLDDKVHDIFLIITQAIQRGDLREPERLMGYVRTVLRRQVAAYIEIAVEARQRQVGLEPALNLTDGQVSPERLVMEQQSQDVAMRVLRGLPKRDRDVLIRFYLQEQTADQICREMKLTETQFRLIKSRAKARYGELGKRRFSQRQGFIK
jgi:RNA polymerase sigma-70 factor (ECF subfamily)